MFGRRFDYFKFAFRNFYWTYAFVAFVVKNAYEVINRGGYGDYLLVSQIINNYGQRVVAHPIHNDACCFSINKGTCFKQYAVQFLFNNVTSGVIFYYHMLLAGALFLLKTTSRPKT